MKAKSLAATVAVALAIPGSAAAQSAVELIDQHTKKAAQALEAYLQENPEAEDSAEAIDFLVDAYARLDMTERQAELLIRKYDALPKGAQLEPQEFFGVYQDLFSLHLRHGNKAAAGAAMAKASADIKGHPQADRFAQFIDQMGSQLKQPAVGDTIEIKFTGLKGEQVDLANLKGKVVLVDFWATWCAPCIAEMPNVLEAYAEYHDKGFEVIGISLDKADAKAKLETFIEEHKLPWPQAYDGGGWQAALAKQFGVGSIPATFLIGKDGKIVAINLRGNALKAAIKEQLGL